MTTAHTAGQPARGGPRTTPTAADLELVAAASRLIAAREGSENHTVAAAARDADGGIHTGVNVYNFAGGPCAELVVIGAAAASTDAALTAIVAVGDHGRGVIPTCGRCRQTLLDYFPDIRVLVPDAGAVTTVEVSALLPWTYDWRAHQELATPTD